MMESTVPPITAWEPDFQVEQDKDDPKIYHFHFRFFIPRSFLTE
jgi:hypothetical protein